MHMGWDEMSIGFSNFVANAYKSFIDFLAFIY